MKQSWIWEKVRDGYEGNFSGDIDVYRTKVKKFSKNTLKKSKKQQEISSYTQTLGGWSVFSVEH